MNININANNTLANRRPAMTLLSGPLCVFSHVCRIVLLEKDVECTIQTVSHNDDPEKIGEYNPYGETPTLLDRDLALYDSPVIVEYLDERFPHPPLMPVDPISRAKARLMTSRLSRDWMTPINQLGETFEPKLDPELKKSIHDGLLALSPILNESPFFMGLEYTLVDSIMSAFLWRLPMLGIELPDQAAPLVEYGDRLFERPAFQESLSEYEIELR